MGISFRISHTKVEKMKKFAKKLAAALMAGTLILGMAVTSFAAETPATVTSDNELEKTWNVAENGLLNDTERFEFTLTYDDADKVGTNETATPQYNGGNMTTKSVEIGTTWKTNAEGGTSATASLSYTDLFKGISFSAPGLYHFTLAEVEGSNPNIDYDGKSYTIDVQVVWNENNDGLVVETVQTTDNTTEKKTDGNAAFVNDEADNSDLTITKTVSGNAANKNDVFTFKVTVSGIDGTYSTDGDPLTNGEVEFTLKHGENFTIYNLPVGAEYTITEVDVDNAYQTTKINDEVDTDRAATGTIGSDDVTVAYENIATVASATGLFLNFAPFVLIFAVAVAGCFVFFRSRRTW